VEELALAEQHGYLNGKNRIPKRLRIKRWETRVRYK
jgi:hypothetical protein